MFTIVAQTDKLNLINPLKTLPGFHLINEHKHFSGVYKLAPEELASCEASRCSAEFREKVQQTIKEN